jgi:hypothetical protein
MCLDEGEIDETARLLEMLATQQRSQIQNFMLHFNFFNIASNDRRHC